MEERKEANSQVSELNLELDLALRRAEEAKAQAKEARDEAVICNIIEESRQLKEQLSANSEKSYVIKQERRFVASYKESKGFCCSLEHASQVMYEFGNQIVIGRFKARYHKLEVNEDPFAELPSDAEVLAPMEVPFNGHPVTPPTLPPPSLCH
ncbi:hypothetical protein BHM03_00011132 [Ensete ventricosum]|nr:hypothetical protein BHM03_00011132 [Ensete ventricosum]